MHRRHLLLAIAALVSGSFVALTGATPARALDEVTVAEFGDFYPLEPCKDAEAGNPGDHGCTLREAVIYANDHPGTTIHLPAGRYDMDLDNAYGAGDFDIRASTTIIGDGAGATIDGNDIDRVFDVTSTAPIDVSFSRVSIIEGRVVDGSGGGGLRIGPNAHVTLTSSSLLNNGAEQDAPFGGGITLYSRTASLVADRVLFDNNYSLASNSSFSTAFGGAIDASFGTATITNSTFVGNVAEGRVALSGRVAGDAYGGAIAAHGEASVSVAASTFVSNSAHGGNGFSQNGFRLGGEAFGGAVSANSTVPVAIVNSTFFNNSALGGVGAAPDGAAAGFGGAIHATDTGPVSLTATTIVGNLAQTRGTGSHAVESLGGGVFGTSKVTVTNSIVARNTVSYDNQRDVGGTVASGGHNLVGTTGTTSFATATDLTGSDGAPLDPGLSGSLSSNGGPTDTVGVLAGSPVVGRGDTAACATVGNVDQRGVYRPHLLTGACDIGAVEYDDVPTTLTLTSSANPSAPGQAITFTASITAESGTPTGTIIFRDGGASLGGGTIGAGVASVTTAALVEGVHTITATFVGDDTLAPAVATLSQQVGTSTTPVTPPAPSPGLQFFPLAHPVRLLDTRAGSTAHVAPGAPLNPNQTMTLPGRVTVGDVTIPASAQALVGNATVDNSSGIAPAGFATLWPSGSELPLASNLNFVPGMTRPNSFTVGLGGDGNFNLLSNTGGNFIVDITGYYAPPAAGGLYFHPLTQPVRLIDTRTTAALTAGQTLSLQGRFTANGITVPSSALALAGNATVDNSIGAPAGFATLYPGGAQLPPTSNLNYVPGTVAPNAFTVGLGGDGTFNLFANSGGNFIVDVTGYYDTVPSGGLLFHALAQPVRELDTRLAATAVVHPDVPLAVDGSIALPGSFGDVPLSAKALVGNATIDNSIGVPAGFATLYPSGAPRPLASNLNYTPGLVAPNAFTVAVGSPGTYELFSQNGSNFIIDISGYFD